MTNQIRIGNLTAMLPLVMSVAQVCEILGCKERQVFYLLERGVLERTARNGREIRIWGESVRRALEPARRGRKPRAARAIPTGFIGKGDTRPYGDR